MAKTENTQTFSRNNLVVILLIGAAFAIGYLWNRVQTLEKTGTTQPADTAQVQQPERPTELKVKKPSTKDDHWEGDKNAQFIMVEYGDFECPFCKANAETPGKLLKDYPGKLAHVWRHFPLSFHPKAQDSAEGSECAAELAGEAGFWKYEVKIFQEMPALELSGLPALASSIGLNQTAFKTCLDSNKYEKRVKDMLSEGTQAGVAATPSTVVYDMKTGKTTLIEGAVPYEQQKQIVEDFIKKQS